MDLKKRLRYIVRKRLQYSFIVLLFLWTVFTMVLLYSAIHYLRDALALFVPRSPEGKIMLQTFDHNILLVLIVTGAGLVLIDLFLGIFSLHRIAGPLHHFHQHLSADAESGQPTPIHLRKGDYLQDLAEAYNALVEKQNKPTQ